MIGTVVIQFNVKYELRRSDDCPHNDDTVLDLQSRHILVVAAHHAGRHRWYQCVARIGCFFNGSDHCNTRHYVSALACTVHSKSLCVILNLFPVHVLHIVTHTVCVLCP